MKVVRYEDVNEFYARVEAYLLADEATHNLTLGLMGTIRHDATRYPQPFFALVEDADAVQLVTLMTPPHPPVLSLARSREAVTTLAEDLFDSGMALPGINGPSDVSRTFAEAWSRRSGQTYRVKVPLRTFRLEKVTPVAGVAGHLRQAALSDRDLLVEWEMGFRREAFPLDEHRVEDAERSIDYRLRAVESGIYVWDDGGAVSYAGYGGPTAHGIRVGPVYTPPDLRGRGYASACVAGMSQLLLDGGRQFCFLFTDLNNPTSNHIYQVIGYQPVCDFTEYGFGG